MFFIVVYWQTNRWGYQTFNDDFEAAVYELDFAHLRGYDAELWMLEDYERKWYRIDFVNNDKHVPYAKPIG